MLASSGSLGSTRVALIRGWHAVLGGEAARPLAAAAGRAALIVVAVLVAAYAHIPGRPASLCVLRTLTGIPCPFCGGTTAAAHLGHGDLRGALAASPLAVGMIVGAPLIGTLPPLHWWRRRRVVRTAVVAVLAAAELWQLARFGFLPRLA